MANLKVNSGGNCSTARQPIEIGLRRSGKVQSQPRIAIVKRPSSAPVSMQGWLHKQGSEGLMLWKKRWFVLSEYCLFYYKNSDEEKVLGSILLPSYKISPCTAVEGKLFRKKYSFKAEHANMRTYYFAADTRERLVQWMNAMSLATIAQEQTNGSKSHCNRDKKENMSISVPNNRLANSAMNATFRNETVTNGVHSHSVENYVQPLYVNAPPKPRRTTESAEQNYAKGNFSHIRSEEFIAESHSPVPRQQFKKMSSNVPLPPLNYNDRRTPDTYGLSPSCDVQTCSPSKTPNKSISDYEELYNLTAAHMYYDNNNEVSHLSNNRNRKFDKLHYTNRPHSVDFLQSEEKNNDSELISDSVESNVSNRKCNYDSGTHVTPPRPKSSIDVISSDCYHWSEEQYAESMRKSAQYLVAKKTQPSFYKTVSGNKLPHNNVNSRTTAEFGINGMSNVNSAPHGQINSEPLYKKCSPSTSGLNKNEVDFMRSKSARISREKQFNDDTEKNLDDVIHKRRNSLHLKELHDRSSQQIQQREESMKRLLEWKQRMLQSPLSRKSSGCSQRDVVKNEFFRDNTLKNMLNENSYPNLSSSPLSEDDNKNTRISQRYYSPGNEKNEPPNESKNLQFKNSDSEQVSKNLYLPPSSPGFNNSLDKYNGRISSEYDDTYPTVNEDAKRKQLRRVSPIDGCEKSDTRRMSVPDGSEVSINENHSHNFMIRQHCDNRAKMTSSTDRVMIDDSDSVFRGAEDEYDTMSKVNSKKFSSTFQMQKQTSTQAQTQTQLQSPRKNVGELINAKIGAVDKPDAASTNADLQRKTLTCERESLPQNIVQDRIKVFEKPFSENTFEEKSHQMKSFPMISSLRAEFNDVAPPLPLSSVSPSIFKAEVNNAKVNDQTAAPTTSTPNNSSATVVEHNVRETLSAIRSGAGYISSTRSGRDLLLDVDWKITTEKMDMKNWRFSPQLQKDGDTREMEECNDTVFGDECKDTENVDVASSPEDHYLPMAPSKKSAVFNAPGDLFYHTRSNSASSASQIMILETLLSEDIENSYVEMTVGQNNSKKLYPHSRSNSDMTVDVPVNKADKSPSSSSSLSSSSSSATVTAAATTHYEFLYKASSCGEPLYMEVYAKEKPKNEDEKEDESPRPSEYGGNLTLPDILNSSNATVARQLNDSSDADDEASKELDPLDLPRHPRFSLSDTFRPASYYLGNGGGCGGGLSDRNALGFSFDQPDSSDSDLVSPPPIPTCPPTMDDDFNSSMDLLPAPPSATATMDRTNGRSHNLDLFASSTDENISLSETDDSFNSKASTFSLKNPLPPIDKCKDTSDVESTDSYYSSSHVAAAAAPFEHNSSGTNDNYNNSDTARPTAAATFVQFPENKDDTDRIQNFKFYENNRDFRGVKSKFEDDSTLSIDEAFPTLPSNSTANFDVHLGAPYYYADILKSNEADKLMNKDFERKREQTDPIAVPPVGTVTASASSVASTAPVANVCATLNNKRENIFENTVACKRNDVGKKVNQIVEVENQLEKARGVTLADMKNTVHNFRIGYKNVDDKNIYNSDVFQNKLGKVNYRSRTPDELLNDVPNFYAHRSRVNSNDSDSLFATTHTKPSGRRSRSFDRLLDADTSQRLSENFNGNRETVDPAVVVPSKSSWTVDDDVWEKDSVWRESLRRTSLRHARSLDDIDREDKPSTKCGRQSADILSSEDTKKSSSSLKKITRDVIYVNDCVSAQIRKAKQNPKEYTEDYREIRKIKRCPRMLSASEGNSGNANVVGADEDAYYERLDPRATLNRSNNNNNNNGGNNNNNNYYYYEGARENITLADNMKQHGKHNTQPKTGAQSFLEEGVYPTKPPSFEIDREKLRQWDLMSSAPAVTHSAIQKYPTSELQIYQTEQNANPAILVSDSTPPNSPASGSASAIGCNQLPFQSRVTPSPSRILQNNDSKCSEPFLKNNDDFHLQSRLTEKLNNSPSPSHYYAKRDDAWNLNVSAGELLGRTHEELVLLLIQLRRQSASVCKAMESCHCEIESQARLIELEKSEKLEHLLRLAELKNRLAELEKQYEKGRPLVNLVDNMVKLGSLYRVGPSNRYNQYNDCPLREKLEFNHKIQEQRLLAEERKEWERISPDHNRLQAKVEELYKLDRELQQESSLLQSLKQDKDLLEYALGGLKYKILSTQGNPLEMERYRRQQLLLEQELSHVRSVLARNSKKLEETVTANAKLEAELVVLRQKLQWNQRSSQEGVVAAPTVAALESELKRVQMLVGNLQRQRTELSVQVRQLTEKSKNLCHQMRHSPTDVIGTESLPGKKRGTNSWIETDLDNGVAQDVAVDKSSAATAFFGSLSSVPLFGSSDFKKNDNFDPAFDPKNNITHTNEISNICYRYPPESLSCEDIDISESDEKMKKFYGILPREKSQEIKTVRIVKRESERRQRDRDRSNIGIPITLNIKRSNIRESTSSEIEHNVLNKVSEEKESHGSTSQQENENQLKNYYLPQKPDFKGTRNTEMSLPLSSRKVIGSSQAVYDGNEKSNKTYFRNSFEADEHNVIEPVAASQNSNRDLYVNKKSENKNGSPQLSPVYQSEAAKEIVQELVLNVDRKSNLNRRSVPKEKRRHHTISNNKPILPLDACKNNTRARDDVDMERALRPRLNGTPDVVRSTLCRTDITKYNAETIDNVIGTPGKILIPERYVPENMPELSREEQDKRLRKADAIRKMLSESSALSAPENENENETKKSASNKNKFEETKRQRDHILQLNQILAQQVMEKSKLVAGISSSNCP